MVGSIDPLGLRSGCLRVENVTWCKPTQSAWLREVHNTRYFGNKVRLPLKRRVVSYCA
ncbi:unnamed protein product [Dovyalis caffra]|uniref:Uncharacterized protein n=1 Tax=Dovyalis caffra TaxID=77055 RepID=A0AAV1S6E0_9ROSI|nr:unnamed protein product [Dovyalis caffra]